MVRIRAGNREGSGAFDGSAARKQPCKWLVPRRVQLTRFFRPRACSATKSKCQTGKMRCSDI